MFKKILIANRGEIALRILRACKELGISSVAVHSTVDANAMHVRLADESVCIGPPSSALSYLSVPTILAACEITGADAVHPGYGFLSENADFSQVLIDHGICFIGPSPEIIELMGDKISARERMATLGLPTIPGSPSAVQSVSEASEIGEYIGYPVIIKAAAGGGGRGMRIVNHPDEFSLAFAQARRESQAAFGDDRVYIEKFLLNPRHIEIQILGDSHGSLITLGDRDCSLQRHHQKIWEEAPSPGIETSVLKQLSEKTRQALHAVGYTNAGTAEFLYSEGEFYFIEVNSRLQVEHPVTEQVTGIDLVHEQIKIAAGEPLSFSQSDIQIEGHVIECRVNAEHPTTFAPSAGRITTYHTPGGLGIRTDSAAYAGYEVPHQYDSLLGKLIVSGADRGQCLMRLRRALDEYVVEGIETTLPLFRKLARHPDIVSGHSHVNWLEDHSRELATEI